MPSALTAPIAGCAVVAVAAGLAMTGVAVLNRGPEPSLAPVMAEHPFLMPDGRTLYVQKYEVTVAEWARCHGAGACALKVRPRPGIDPASLPATGLSFTDVGQYVAWLSDRTGHPFRLPTLAEWTAIADEVLPESPDPIFTDPALTWASAYLVENLPPRTLEPAGSFSTTSQGIADLDGSVWEWTADCYGGDGPDRCAAYYVGGEHVAAIPYLVRDPARGGCAVGSPPAHLGFRLVTDHAPPGA